MGSENGESTTADVAGEGIRHDQGQVRGDHGVECVSTISKNINSYP
jgi:DnaJ-class molecular chaperone